MKFNVKKAYPLVFVILLLLILMIGGFFYYRERSSIKSTIVPDGETLVVSFLKTNIEKVDPLTAFESKALPDSLVIEPGYYSINDQIYDFHSEGLYRIMVIPEANFQRVVYKKDVTTLLSSLAWIDTHGTRDDKLSVVQLEEKAKNEKIITTCGPISKFAKYILEKQSIDSRVVSAITKEPKNGFDDSHTMIEVKIGSDWQVFDLDNNTYFTKNNQPLSFPDLLAAINQNSDFGIVKIASDPDIAIANFKDDNSYDYSLYGEAMFSTDIVLKNWYKRVLGTAI